MLSVVIIPPREATVSDMLFIVLYLYLGAKITILFQKRIILHGIFLFLPKQNDIMRYN